MFLGRRRIATPGAVKPSALDELLGAEQEIAAQMAAAGEEAAEIVAAARTEAASYEGAAAAALEAELAALAERDALARAELTRSLEAESARLVARYDALGSDEIARLAAFVIADVTGLAPEGSA